MIAFDAFENLRKEGASRKKIIEKINKEFVIPIGTLYDWYRRKHIPYGRKGEIAHGPEMFYVLGALLGDGCLYKWKSTHNHTILIGDKRFTEKYSKFLSACTGKSTKPYIDRSKNIWFVRTNNFALYELFKKSRENPDYLRTLLNKAERRESLLFIEGFFDAEGCVKIIKEEVRKTPKICLDITNTNFAFLELIRELLHEQLNISARYSIQRPDGTNTRRTAWHLRIYKKEFVKRFLENIRTTKLRREKTAYVRNWFGDKIFSS